MFEVTNVERTRKKGTKDLQSTRSWYGTWPHSKRHGRITPQSYRWTMHSIQELRPTSLIRGCGPEEIFTTLIRMPQLRKLHLMWFPTSWLLPLLQQIPLLGDIRVDAPIWDLDDNGRSEIARRWHGIVPITFHVRTNKSDADEAEIAFWKSIPAIRMQDLGY